MLARRDRLLGDQGHEQAEETHKQSLAEVNAMIKALQAVKKENGGQYCHETVTELKAKQKEVKATVIAKKAPDDQIKELRGELEVAQKKLERRKQAVENITAQLQTANDNRRVAQEELDDIEKRLAEV